MNTRHVFTDDTKIENCIIGEKCGTITVSVYKEKTSNSPIFHIQIGHLVLCGFRISFHA